MRKLFLIIVLVTVMVPLSAQKYGFYGRGKDAHSYNSGVEGVYIGYHPAGVSHSRNANIYFLKTESRRSGSKIQHNKKSRNQGFNFSGVKRVVGDDYFSGVTYNTVDVKVSTDRGNGDYDISRGSRVNLGLSTEVSDSKSYIGGFYGGSSSGVKYGRTGGLSSVSGKLGLASFSSSMPQLATTTNSNNYSDGDQAEQQGFLEAPEYEVPIGDALLPLLLLIIPIIIVKVKMWGCPRRPRNAALR